MSPCCVVRRRRRGEKKEEGGRFGRVICFDLLLPLGGCCSYCLGKKSWERRRRRRISFKLGCGEWRCETPPPPPPCGAYCTNH